jgi:hypothetical protein
VKKRKPKTLMLNRETLRSMDFQQTVGGVSMARCGEETLVSACVTDCPSCGPSYDPDCYSLWCTAGCYTKVAPC